MKYLIYVPQGAFAQINKDTHSDIVGLVTANINTCCHIIVTNTKNGYLSLCHADASTEISSAGTGLSRWIQNACPEKDYNNLKVYVGDDPIKGGRASEVSPTLYTDQVKDVLQKMKLQIEPIYTQHRPTYGILIFRPNNNFVELIDQSRLKDVFKTVKKDTPYIRDIAYDDNDVTAARVIHDLKTISLEVKEFKIDGHIVEGDFFNARVYALLNKFEGGHKFKPICVFDGLSDNFVDIEEICKNHKHLNDRRLSRHASYEDGSSGNDHSYNSSPSSFSSAEGGTIAEPKHYKLGNKANEYDKSYWQEKSEYSQQKEHEITIFESEEEKQEYNRRQEKSEYSQQKEHEITIFESEGEKQEYNRCKQNSDRKTKPQDLTSNKKNIAEKIISTLKKESNSVLKRSSSTGGLKSRPTWIPTTYHNVPKDLYRTPGRDR